MLKKFLPNSLFGRFLLIILLPNIIIQLVAVYIFYERHWSGVSRHMSTALTGEIFTVIKSLESQQLENKDNILEIARKNLYLDIELEKNGLLLLKENQKQEPFIYDQFAKDIDTKLQDFKHSVYYTDNQEIAIDVEIPEGLLHITTSKKRIANPSTYIFVMWMTGTALIFVLISIFFMRTQVRSITTLATVADKFGKGHDSDNFKPTGATEVRQVAQAFIDMRERIKKQVEQRTEMLAGVSHDLRTPLTRLKLQLALLEPSKEIQELQEDISEMEKMIQGYLDFAKGKERVIDASVNITDLSRSIIAGYRNHHKKIELKAKTGVKLHVNSNAFRRAITNITDNALRYSNSIQITVSTSSKNMIMMIDDDGPGIPVKKRDLVFKPFYRIDSSRHVENGSTGLGLSIAKDIIIGYGGSIKLDDSPLGGLRVIIKIPL